MLQVDYSAILLVFNKLPMVIKIILSGLFTDFIVYPYELNKNLVLITITRGSD